MKQQQLEKFLDKYAEWYIDEDDRVLVVKRLKQVARSCEWCNNTCTKPKLFKKSLSTGFWYARCPDCKETRDFDPDIF